MTMHSAPRLVAARMLLAVSNRQEVAQLILDHLLVRQFFIRDDGVEELEVADVRLRRSEPMYGTCGLR